MLDIHIDSRPSEEDEPPLQILEAGTGHGALTLHLARAIHGANTPIPLDALAELDAELRENASSASNGSEESASSEAAPLTDTNSNEDEESSAVLALNKFKETRHAIIHTVEVKAAHSQRARQVVRGFRRGIYAGDVDFYVGDVDEWISAQLTERRVLLGQEVETSFLSHIVLDAPDSQNLIAKAAQALLTGGSLVLFCPSVSQIMTAVKMVKARKLPLVMDRVLETGPSLTGGREWDVRAVKPRSLIRAEATRKQTSTIEELSEDQSSDSASLNSGTHLEELLIEESEDSNPGVEDAGWEMICRPKVGERLVGGGFLGVWKKMKQR